MKRYTVLKLLLIFLTLFFNGTSLAHEKCSIPFAGKTVVGSSSALKWYFNTSNPTKKAHLSPLLTSAGVEFLSQDLNEIQADHLSVVVHKASQFDEENSRVIVEDTALYIEGADIGENIRWKVDSLSQYIGRKATWVSLIAYRDGDFVRVYRSISTGTIGGKIDGKEGIEAYFRPETIDGYANNRSTPPSFTALRRLLKDDLFKMVPIIETWNGAWQGQHSSNG